MSDGLTVEWVDSEDANYYNEHRETIVLDERLKEYPDLKKFILSHELKHRAYHKLAGSRLRKLLCHAILDSKDNLRIMYETKYKEYRRKECKFSPLDQMFYEFLSFFGLMINIVFNLSYLVKRSFRR